MKLKGVLRIVYIVFGVVMAIIVAIMAYNTNGYNYIYTKTQTAIQNKTYTEVAKIHGGNFWDESLYTNTTNENVDVVFYPASTLTSITYYTDTTKDTTKTEYVYENAYYIYTFVKGTYSSATYSLGGVTTNNTGLKFYGDNGSSYLYYYTVSETVNSNLYTSKPTSANATILNGVRSPKTYSNWGFYSITLTDSMIKAMQTSGLNGSINKVEVIDAAGNAVESIDINLNFNHKYFEIITPLVTEYNKYIAVQSDSASTDAQKSAATEAFNKFYNDSTDENGNTVKGFESTFLSNEHCTFRYSDSELQPSSLVWQTIGVVALVFVVLILLYMLLFHFKFLKSLVSRERWAGKKNLGTRARVVNNQVKANSKEVKDTKVNEAKAKAIETKETEVKEALANVEEAKEDTDNKSE